MITLDPKWEAERKRIQALGAAISRRNMHEVEQAYNAIRDDFDRREIEENKLIERMNQPINGGG